MTSTIVRALCFVLSLGFLVTPLVAARAAQEAPPRKEVVDDDFAFRMRAPGERWWLLDRATADTLLQGALCGGTHGPSGAWFALLARPTAETDLDAATAVIAEGVLGRPPTPQTVVPAKLGELEARRFHGHVGEDGAMVGYVGFVVLRDGFVFQLTVWGPSDAIDPDGELVDVVRAAFIPLDGPVRGRPEVELAPRRGVDWSWSDGVLYSTAYGIEVHVPDAWRPLLGAELATIRPDALIGLQHRGSSAFGTIVASRTDVNRTKAVADELRASRDPSFEPRDLDWTLPICGQDVLVQGFHDPTTPPYDFVRVVHAYPGGTVLELLFWTPSSSRAALETALRATPPRIEAMLPTTEMVLHHTWDSVPDPQNEVTAELSLRNGVVRDHAQGIHLTKPSRRWRAGLVGNGPDGGGVRCVLEQITWGITVRALALPTWDEPEAMHAAVLEAFAPDMKDAPSPTQTEHEGQPMLSSEVTTPDHRQWLVMTRVVDDRLYGFVADGPPVSMAGNREAVLDVVRLARLGPGITPATETIEDGHVDHRLGYAFASPGQAWALEPVALAGAEDVAGGVAHVAKGRRLVAAAICVPDGVDPAGLEALLLRTIGGLGAGATSEPSGLAEASGLRHEGTLHTSADGTRQVLLVRRGRTLHLLAATREEGPASIEDARARFRFLD